MSFSSLQNQGPVASTTTIPVSQPAQQVYRAYQPSVSGKDTGRDGQELGFSHTPTNRGLSFSELVTSVSPTGQPPARTMTPAQELAAARERSKRTPLSPQATRRGEVLRREVSVLSEISGRGAEDTERERMSRGDSVVSGRTEYRVRREG